MPLAAGYFDLHDYVDYCLAMFAVLGPDLHVMAVCQPSVPVLAAIALMEAQDHPLVPCSATLLGGPIDTRRSPTAVNRLAQERGLAWFERHCIHPVPWAYPGSGGSVYPGFLQLAGFMSMNLDRHVSAHWDMFDGPVAKFFWPVGGAGRNEAQPCFWLYEPALGRVDRYPWL